MTATKNKKLANELQELAILAKDGDNTAFHQIVEKAAIILCRYVMRKLVDDDGRRIGQLEDAEEITNDTFLRIFNYLPKWDTDMPFIALLYVTAQRLTIDWLRKNHHAVYVKGKGGGKNKLPVNFIPIGDGTDNEDEKIISQYADIDAQEFLRIAEIEEVKTVMGAVIDRELGEKQGEVVKRVINGEEYDTIAVSMQIDVSVVRSYYSKATKKLRENESVKSMLSAVAFFGIGDGGMAEISASAGLSAKIMESIGANTTTTTTAAATTTAATATTGAAVSNTGIGALIMGLGAGAKAGIAIAAAVVIVGGVSVPVYLHNENQKAVQAMAIVRQQEEAAEQSRIEAEAKAASEKAASEKAASEKAASEKAASEKAEAERKAAEEKAEQERIAAEEAARLEAEEAERIAAEEAAARQKAEAEAAAQTASKAAAQSQAAAASQSSQASQPTSSSQAAASSQQEQKTESSKSEANAAPNKPATKNGYVLAPNGKYYVTPGGPFAEPSAKSKEQSFTDQHGGTWFTNSGGWQSDIGAWRGTDLGGNDVLCFPGGNSVRWSDYMALYGA